MFLFQSILQSRSRRQRILMEAISSIASLVTYREPKVLSVIAFDSIDISLFIEKYRFSKDEVILIQNDLGLGHDLILDNGCKVESKLALVILLHRLSTPVRLVDLGNEYQLQSSTLRMH